MDKTEIRQKFAEAAAQLRAEADAAGVTGRSPKTRKGTRRHALRGEYGHFRMSMGAISIERLAAVGITPEILDACTRCDPPLVSLLPDRHRHLESARLR